MTKFFKIISAAAFSAALIFAQGPGGRGGGPPDPQAMLEQRVAFLTARLGLTDDQKAQATTIYTNAGTAAQSIRTTLQTTHQSLSDAVKANNIAAIDQLSSTIGTLTGQLTAIDRKADASFYALLTPEQKTKFDQNRGPGFRGMGPEGRGRFGPSR